MRLPYIYKEGELIGDNGISFISELKSINHRRYAVVKCNCGKIFKTQIAQVKFGHTKSCGCMKHILHLKRITTHGMCKSPIYKIWDDIRTRVTNKNTPYFKNYGGRGITIFSPWIYDFQLFYDYVSALPFFGKKGYSIDRIDNDGNYEPGNLRWTTKHVQLTNIRILERNTSGYTGVCRHKGAWDVQITVNGNHFYLGRRRYIEDAVKLRNNYIIANNLTEYKIQTVKT